MARSRTTAGIALAALLATGCAALAPPKPPAYTGADTVDEVSRDVFVGTWRLTALNPIESDEPPPETTVTYRADGTYSAEIQPTPQMVELMGPEPVRSSGRWSVANGRIRNETTEVEMPGGDDAVSRFVSRMMRDGFEGAMASEAEVYEAGPRRIVVVTEDGYATALERS